MGDTATPPISAELWARLKRFDPHCFIGFERTTPFWRRQWKHVPRVWRVTVHAHDALAWEYLHAENPSLEPALVPARLPTHGPRPCEGRSSRLPAHSSVPACERVMVW